MAGQRSTVSTRRMLQLALGTVMLAAGAVGTYFATAQLYRAVEVRWWDEHQCVVERRWFEEVELFFGSPETKLRLSLRDLETGRIYPDADLTQPYLADFDDPYYVQPVLAEYGIGVRVPCRISPGGHTAVVRPARLVVPFFLALGVLASLLLAGTGAVAVWPSLLGLEEED